MGKYRLSWICPFLSAAIVGLGLLLCWTNCAGAAPGGGLLAMAAKSKPAPADEVKTAAPAESKPKAVPAEEQPPPPKAEQTQKPTEDKTGDPNAAKVVVTINGVDITESQVQEKMAPLLQQASARTQQMPPDFIEQYKQQLRQQVIESLIVEQLLNEQVAKNGIVITDRQTMEKIEEMAAAQDLSMDDFKALVAAYGQDFEQVKQRVQTGLAYETLIDAKFANQTDVTIEQARKYYDENIDNFKTAPQVRASHILIKTDPADSNEAKAAKKAQIRDLLVQIKEGADFAELAKEHSACPSSANGGDLGYFGPGQMVAPFEQTAFALLPGEVSDIVETRFGYHIITVTGRKDASVKEFDEVAEELKEQLVQEKRSRLVLEYVEQLKANAEIVYAEPDSPKWQITD